MKERRKPAEDKTQAGKMFDRIYKRYDLLNHVLTLGLDRRWRKILAISLARSFESKEDIKVLDLATGTGDLALAVKKRKPMAILTCADISENMMKLAAKKMETRNIENAQFLVSDAAALQFEDGQFDAVTIAFGVRNFPLLEQSLKETHRVLNKGGYIYILEFGWPGNKIWSALYSFFSRTVLPLAGWAIAGDKAAYTYLKNTIRTFPYAADFEAKMLDAGYSGVSFRKLAGGIVYLYEGKK